MTDTSKAELDAIFAQQKNAFTADRYPSLEARLERLRALDNMMIAREFPPCPHDYRLV